VSSEFQARIFVGTAGAFAQLQPPRRRVELITPNAVESRLAALSFKTEVITAIIVIPERQEAGRHDHAVDHGAGGQIKHGKNLGGWSELGQVFRTVSRAENRGKKNAPTVKSTRLK
jgi:hypothetical protein